MPAFAAAADSKVLRCPAVWANPLLRLPSAVPRANPSRGWNLGRPAARTRTQHAEPQREHSPGDTDTPAVEQVARPRRGLGGDPERRNRRAGLDAVATGGGKVVAGHPRPGGARRRVGQLDL